MRTLSISSVLALLLLLGFSACSSDEEVVQALSDEEEQTDDTLSTDDEPTYHFDVVMSVGKHGGMNRNVTTIVRSIASVDASVGPISITGTGCEINTTYTMESIYRGKYYYQVPISADRFVKFHIADNAVVIDQQQKFASGYTYSARRYAHAWMDDDNTLLIISSNGDKDAIIWTKLNADDLSIIDNGTLDITLAEGYDTFTTSGIAAYREADDKLFYFYYNKIAGTYSMDATNEAYFHVVAIDAETMTVESDEVNAAYANEMAGSAYGELLQDITFEDEDGNIYLAAFVNMPADADHTSAWELGQLLRINAGETNFDPDYNGFDGDDGKLLTVQYMGNGQVFAFSRSDAVGMGIDNYSHYYSVVDIDEGDITRMAYAGEDIPYSSGRFSQRSTLHDGKVYFGINPSDSNPMIYIYDIDTQTVSQGAQIEEGYYFDQLRLLEDY